MLRMFPLVLTLAGAGSVWSQSVISAHSGVIHYVEGHVTVDGKPVQPKFAEFPDIKLRQTLAAEDGRAEVLLTPGVFLRVAENSSFQMLSNKLTDTRLEILTGSAIVEVAELLADNAIALQFRDARIALLKKGLYRVDVDPGLLQVYEGEARVTSGSQTIVARKGREVEFGTVLQTRSFDPKSTDAFYRWSARREEYVAQANVSSAKSAQDAGFGYTTSSFAAGSWAWNPYFGLFTYLPASGIYFSPFGPAYYSPGFVNYIYAPVYAGGYRGFSSTGGTLVAPRSGAPVSSGSAISSGGLGSPGFGRGSAGGSHVGGGLAHGGGGFGHGGGGHR